MAETLHSVHTFMLPIRWDYLPEGFDPLIAGKGSIPFDERTGLQQFANLLTPQKTNTPNLWKRHFYRINDNISNYNELVYYHAHAANNFFDLQREDEQTEFIVSNNKSILYFEMQGINEATDRYTITIAEERSGKSNQYALRLSGITLHVFTTGIAILSFALKNYGYPEKEDILYINEFGRRIYPPFLTERDGLSGTKQLVLAEKIELTINSLNPQPLATENFARYGTLAANNIETHLHEGNNYYNTVIDFPDFTKKVFPTNKFVFTAKQEKESGEKISFRLLTSDRMFFQCWYGNNEIAKSVSREMNLYNGSPSFTYAHCPFWYAFLYGDKNAGSLSIANKYLMEEQLTSNTYTRWAAYGTLFGFSKDSFVCISSDLDTLKKNHVPDLSIHMQTMYYQIAVLCLAQRASVLRFSGEVSALADLGKQWDDKISERIQGLNLNYLEFINKIYYREITPEIQGIEIYNHFQKAMKIERDVHDLQMEISELHNFAMMKKQDELAQSQAIQTNEQTKMTRQQTTMAEQQTSLSTIATIFLPAGFILGLLALISDKELKWGHSVNWFYCIAIIIYLLIPFSILFFLRSEKAQKKLIDFFSKKEKKD